MNVYEIVLSKITAELERGNAPWRRPWSGGGPPSNLVSKKPYSGINLLLLASNSYASPYYLTYKQAGDLGGNVRKGEHGHMVTFYRKFEDEEDANGKPRFMLRYYTVFNYSQCENLPPLPEIETHDWDPIEEAELMISAWTERPTITTDPGKGACYTPATDTVSLPPRDRFESPTGFYETLFHELVHSTGHASRLDRESIRGEHRFGSKEYSREELVAEIGAGFLCAHVGIESDISNLAAYCKSWLQKLRDDPQAIFFAASRASKAVLSITGEEAAK